MSKDAKVGLGFLLAALILLPGRDARAVSLSIDVGPVGGVVHLMPTLTETSPGVFASTGEKMVMGSFDFMWNLQLHSDPSLSGSFTLTNLNSSTQTFSVSATLGVAAILGPTLMNGSFGDLTYTDTNDMQVALDTVGMMPFYQATIDGSSVQDLGSFHLSATGSSVGVSGTFSKMSFGTPIPVTGPGVSTSIGVSFPAFQLTGLDMVQTPFEFAVVVPEPASLALLGLGLGLGGLLYAGLRKKGRA